VLLERHHVGAMGKEWGFTLLDRCLIAGRALWFYAGKLVWPAKLTFIYPRWEISAAVWWQWLFPLAAVGVVTSLWFLRNRIGRGPLVAVLFFAGTLFPALGFVNTYPMLYSFVADHFQYLASAGLIALAAAGLAGRADGGQGRARTPCAPVTETSGGQGTARPAKIRRALGLQLALLLALGIMTWRQCGIYRNPETLWLDTLTRNPACWMAHNNLAYGLYARGELDEAIRHYRQALRFKPDYPEALGGLGTALSQQGGYAPAIPLFEAALKIRSDDPDVHKNFGSALAATGRMDEAIAHFQESIRLQPGDAGTHYNLANALVLRRRFPEAETAYHAALRLAPDSADARRNLGLLLVRLGRHDEAVAQLKEALRLRPDDAPAREQLRLWEGPTP
jgi:protein O-mannosyl-transferase